MTAVVEEGDLIVRREGAAGVIRINRPKAINAMTLEMSIGIGAALDRFEADPDVAVIILEGAGERGLCAGGDIRGLIRAADAYIKVSNDQTKIVPGHGKLANKTDMIAWREMLITSRDRIQKLINEGKTEQEVLAANPLADLNAKWAANEEQSKNWTRMVYNSFKRS